MFTFPVPLAYVISVVEYTKYTMLYLILLAFMDYVLLYYLGNGEPCKVIEVADHGKMHDLVECSLRCVKEERRLGFCDVEGICICLKII